MPWLRYLWVAHVVAALVAGAWGVRGLISSVERSHASQGAVRGIQAELTGVALTGGAEPSLAATVSIHNPSQMDMFIPSMLLYLEVGKERLEGYRLLDAGITVKPGQQYVHTHALPVRPERYQAAQGAEWQLRLVYTLTFPFSERATDRSIVYKP